jgi:hypothetical protein
MTHSGRTMMAVELPREEVAPRLGTLTACGFLILSVLRVQLWQTWERIALARLAAAMPWNGEILAAETTTVPTRAR